jgi:KAP family P-loop domain
LLDSLACRLGCEGVVSKRLGSPLSVGPLTALGEGQKPESTNGEARGGGGLGALTTSSENTKQEICRFLQGTDPQTLCVTGKWGVGKTFLWSTTLDDLRKSNRLSLARYSYVSLFGLNSLDYVKSALFENMEWLDQNATSFTQRGKAAAKAIGARAKKFSELAGALPWIGQALSKARPLYFSLFKTKLSV